MQFNKKQEKSVCEKFALSALVRAKFFASNVKANICSFSGPILTQKVYLIYLAVLSWVRLTDANAAFFMVNSCKLTSS